MAILYPMKQFKFLLIMYGLFLGHTRITSKFGPRKAPTAGASSYHLGIDVGAPAGSALVAITSGYISFTGFKGANGYMITLISDEYTISYCHVSPAILVSSGNSVSKGQIIGYVGPKNVYGVANNPYKDSNRKSYEWFNNWSTFTLWGKKKWDCNRPINFILLNLD